MFLRVSVENLGLFPGVQSVVDQGGQHNVVVEVGAFGVLVQVDRVQEDPQSVGGEARDGVPECDAVTWQSELNTPVQLSQIHCTKGKFVGGPYNRGVNTPD